MLIQTLQPPVILPKTKSWIRLDEYLYDQVTIFVSAFDRLQESGRAKTVTSSVKRSENGYDTYLRSYITSGPSSATNESNAPLVRMRL